jgi:hypothetical protein
VILFRLAPGGMAHLHFGQVHFSTGFTLSIFIIVTTYNVKPALEPIRFSCP